MRWNWTPQSATHRRPIARVHDRDRYRPVLLRRFDELFVSPVFGRRDVSRRRTIASCSIFTILMRTSALHDGNGTPCPFPRH